MVGIFETEVKRLDALDLEVIGNDKTIDHVVLEFVRIVRGRSLVRLVQGTAARCRSIHGKLPVIRELVTIQLSAVPAPLESRIHRSVDVRKALIEVTAGDHVVPVIILHVKILA